MGKFKAEASLKGIRMEPRRLARALKQHNGPDWTAVRQVLHVTADLSAEAPGVRLGAKPGAKDSPACKGDLKLTGRLVNSPDHPCGAGLKAEMSDLKTVFSLFQSEKGDLSVAASCTDLQWPALLKEFGKQETDWGQAARCAPFRLQGVLKAPLQTRPPNELDGTALRLTAPLNISIDCRNADGKIRAGVKVQAPGVQLSQGELNVEKADVVIDAGVPGTEPTVLA